MINFLLVIPFLLWGDVFIKDAELQLPQEIKLVTIGGYTGWEQVALSPDGENLYLLDLDFSQRDTFKYYTETPDGEKDFRLIFGPPESIVLLYKGKIKQTKVLASSGEMPHQVSFPTSIAVDTDGNIYVGDNKNRRVTILNSNGEFLSSFIISADSWPPLDIVVNSKRELYLAGLKLDPEGRLNSGDWITNYDFDGNYLKSFAYTPDIAFKLNLWQGVSANIEIGEKDQIYLVFAPEHKIYVYGSDGNLKKTFGEPPEWFTYPEKLALPIWDKPKAPPDFWKSFTPVIKLIYLGDNRLLVATKTNGLVKGTSKKFILDLYNTLDGEPILKGIETDYFPFGTDTTSAIYFISPEDKKVIKTYLKEDIEE